MILHTSSQKTQGWHIQLKSFGKMIFIMTDTMVTRKEEVLSEKDIRCFDENSMPISWDSCTTRLQGRGVRLKQALVR